MTNRQSDTVSDNEGVPMYNGLDYKGCMVPVYSDEHDLDLKAMERLQPAPEGGIIICSYPRSGNQWIFETIKTLNSRKPEPVQSPLFEFSFLENAAKFGDGKLFSNLLYTHFSPDLIPPQLLEAYKIVSIIRNPKDIAVSFYHLLCNFLLIGYQGSWSSFLEMYMKGTVPYGSWFDWASTWEKYSSIHNVYTLSYENLALNYNTEVRKLSQFLDIPVDNDFCDKLAKSCSFENMKQEKVKNLPPFMKDMWRNGECGILRKGRVGDWKHWFTVSQNDAYNALFSNRMRESDFVSKFPSSFSSFN